MVTGAGSWLGKATATALARLGASACPWLCRDVAWGRAAADEVEAAVPVHRCDVSDLAPVRAFAGELSESVDRVDVRVHNAGDATRAHRGRRPGPSGRGVLEWDARAKTAGRRPGVPHRDVCRATAYARTKRMQVALAPLMQERWAADGIAVHTIEAALRSCRGRG